MLVIIGTALLAFTVNFTIIPNRLGEGGVTGVTLGLYYWLGWRPAVVSFILNAVLLVIGWRFLEKATIFYTLISMVVTSIVLEWATGITFVAENALVAMVVSGVLMGFALGIVTLGGGSTGGIDIIAWILKKRFGLGIPQGLFLIDLGIVTPLMLLIGFEKGALTFMMLYILTKTMNFVIEGLNPKKSVTIISRQHEAIATRLHQEVGRGITLMPGQGFYSKDQHTVLYVVINSHQLLKAQTIIHDIDPQAFVTITNVQQVIGEGFTYFLTHDENEINSKDHPPSND